MKKVDWFFLFIFIFILALLIIPFTRIGIENLSSNHPYFMGFVKTAILATYGELLASRIYTKKYFYNKGLFFRFIIWGFLGMTFVLVFKIFDGGVNAAISTGLLFNIDIDNFWNKLYVAFTISFFMNLIFAPTFMILHRFTDTFIDLGEGKLKKIFKVQFKDVIEKIDWNLFFTFIVLKTIPLFWIPAHTITFLLPDNYRILSAGFLSIALGLILTITKLRKEKIND
jgi:hypothetical protein